VAIRPTGRAGIGAQPRGVNKPLIAKILRDFWTIIHYRLAKPSEGGRKVRLPSSVFVPACAMLLAGCGYTPEQRATSGAALGGATGAAIGAAAGGGPGAALAGGILGAATGAVVGANTAPPPPPPPPPGYGPGYYPPPPPRCARMGYDPYGNPVCVAYYGY
jgi:hypothetical protein